MSDREFEYSATIRWGDCDPAGIIYFPRYFDLFHQAMEAWFGDALGQPYAEIIEGRRLGFPAVHTEADFMAPSAFGDRVVVGLRVPRLGRSSVALSYRVWADGDATSVRAVGKTVCAVMDIDPGSPTFRRAVELPADLRGCIEQFRNEQV